MSEIVSSDNKLMGNFVKTLLTDESFEIDNITNLVESKSM
jgi:hypothetical protein